MNEIRTSYKCKLQQFIFGLKRLSCMSLEPLHSTFETPVVSFEKFGSLEGTRGIKRNIEKEENFVFDSLFVDARSLN